MNHMNNPTYSSSSDLTLVKTLNPDKDVVGDLGVGSQFIYRNELYTVIQKLRKNFKCKSEKTGGMFIFPPAMGVKVFSSTT